MKQTESITLQPNMYKKLIQMYEAIDFETREKLDMRLIKVDGLVYIKYTPFNSTAEIEEQAVFATELVNNLIEFSNCIASCSLMKSLFRQIASKFTSLVLLNVTDVKPSKFDQILNEYAFKIGAVRFEPTLKGLDDNSIEEINKKIIEIVKLSSPLFFTGKTNSGSVCVGLGIPTEAYTASIIKDILMYIEAVGVIVEHDFIEELQKVVQEEIKRVERRQSNWSLSSLGNLFGFEEEKMHRFDSKAHF